jgi:hypothetical protein
MNEAKLPKSLSRERATCSGALPSAASTSASTLCICGLVRSAKTSPMLGPRGTLSRRLTAGQAREIVKLASEGLERHELAERFGVSQVTIKAVLQGRTWSEATGIQYRGPLNPGRPRKPENQRADETGAIMGGRLPCTRGQALMRSLGRISSAGKRA